MKRRLTILTLALGAILVSACGGGYTQDEVDALVADAVDTAVADAKDDLISEQEAQEQADAAAKQASLQAAVDTCKKKAGTDWSGTRYISVDEGGMFIDGDGDESLGANYEDIGCVLVELETPDSVIGRMDHTTSMMGLVEGSWGDYEAQWSYHPDNGMDMTIAVVS